MHCKSQSWLGHQNNLVGHDYEDGGKKKKRWTGDRDRGGVGGETRKSKIESSKDKYFYDFLNTGLQCKNYTVYGKNLWKIPHRRESKESHWK